jgi:hypothetical protein
MSYGEVPALLVEEDLRCPSVHYSGHKQAPKWNHQLDGQLPHMKEFKVTVGFEPTLVSDKQFEVNNLNQ